MPNSIRQASGFALESVINLLKKPVKVVFFVIIACVVYLSAQAYISMTSQSDPVTEEMLPTTASLPVVSLPAILYDHPVAPLNTTHLVSYGDTLGKILEKASVSDQDINRIITCRSQCKRLNELKPGTHLDLRLDRDFNLVSIVKRESNGSNQQFNFHPNRIESLEPKLNREVVPTYQHVVIRAGESPIRAAQRAGDVRESTVLRATQILEYDIDFWRNIHPNDEFEIYYDKVFINGTYVEDGTIHVLKFINQGKLFTAYRHANGMHYAADGSAIRKQFLKAPLRYKRISSNFSNARRHPILGYTRAHRGVDYAAPTGTPVRSTANGTIERTVYGDRQAGNYVSVQHGNGFQTRYLHLSRIAKGIKPGVVVSRGRTIGYVGSTGLSTGPHLHYEVIKNGRHLNPLNVPNPSVNSLVGIQKNRFLNRVAQLDQSIAALRDENQEFETIATVH